MSTTYDREVAVEYAARGDKSECSIFEIEFDGANRGAKVKWASQFSYEEELLYPPCTYLTCKSIQQIENTRYIKVNAAISTARVDLKKIITVTDTEKDNDCLDFVLDRVNL